MPEPVLLILPAAAFLVGRDLLVAPGAIAGGCLAVAGGIITHPIGWVIVPVRVVTGSWMGAGPWP